MNEQELLDIQVRMAKVFREIRTLPLDKFIEETDTALTVAPLIDPTLYIQKGKDAERWLRIAKIFRTCRDTIRKEFKKAPKDADHGIV